MTRCRRPLPSGNAGHDRYSRARWRWIPGALVTALALTACVAPRGPAPQAVPGDSAVVQSVTARYPRNASRFELQPINDSVIVFDPAEVGWVREGMVGVAVDPARRDALVGQLRVLAVRDGRAEALVLGQTTRLAEGHVLLLVSPAPSWWKRGAFWWGAVTGALLGIVATTW